MRNSIKKRKLSEKKRELLNLRRR